MSPTLFISAGEASGEAYGALLIEELKTRLAAQGREAHFVGMGGPRMAAAGLDRVVRAEDVAVMGITEVVRHLPRIYREFRKLKQALRDRRPSVAVLIDFPDIHFKLAQECRRLGIPVVFFVSPQLWAWKKHRIKLVQRYVDRMLVIFPFEEPFYRERGVNAEFVGHPLAELPAPTISREEFAAANDLNPAYPWIALLPGSRAKEIRGNLPEMLAAARQLSRAAADRKKRVFPQFILPLAPTLTSAQREFVRRLALSHAAKLMLRLVPDAQAALFHARASIVASGTATVEAALIGNPFVVVYRVSPITYAIARRVVTVPHVAMVNLIAGKLVIPELIQNDFTASNIVRQLQPLLPDGPPRQSMMKELAMLRGMLRARTQSAAQPPAGAIARVAEVVLELLGGIQRTGAAQTAAPEPL
ncbi:MAG TPA: lipid-A-disaccharide synthase [Terracidiphilus sp.]|nr:lipid-A-disaccharide synthase [Terracidiphilus sp.]